MVKRKVKHKIGASWKATRKINGKRKRVMVKKVGKSRYKVHVLKSHWKRDRKTRSNERWERRRKRRRRR